MTQIKINTHIYQILNIPIPTLKACIYFIHMCLSQIYVRIKIFFFKRGEHFRYKSVHDNFLPNVIYECGCCILDWALLSSDLFLLLHLSESLWVFSSAFIEKGNESFCWVINFNIDHWRNILSKSFIPFALHGTFW